jgi:DNA-binding transcriptional MerR regulator
VTQKPTYLTLKRAAQALGVHEQTLRSWERRGLIRLARLPQSGYRRVPVEEVARLQAAMLTSEEPSSVRLVPPRLDPDALAKASTQATAVRTELAEVESTITFDEFMQAWRGRTWSP